MEGLAAGDLQHVRFVVLSDEAISMTATYFAHSVI